MKIYLGSSLSAALDLFWQLLTTVEVRLYGKKSVPLSLNRCRKFQNSDKEGVTVNIFRSVEKYCKWGALAHAGWPQHDSWRRGATVTVKGPTPPVMTGSLNKASSVTMEAYSQWGKEKKNLERLIVSLIGCSSSRRTTMSNAGWRHVMSRLKGSFPQRHNRTSITVAINYAESQFAMICIFFFLILFPVTFS